MEFDIYLGVVRVVPFLVLGLLWVPLLLAPRMRSLVNVLCVLFKKIKLSTVSWDVGSFQKIKLSTLSWDVGSAGGVADYFDLSAVFSTGVAFHFGRWPEYISYYLRGRRR